MTVVLVLLFIQYMLAPNYGLVQQHEQNMYDTIYSGVEMPNFAFEIPFKKEALLNDYADQLTHPLGVIAVTEVDANVRSSVDYESTTNIQWVANKGERFAYYDTQKLGNITWYHILKPGTVYDYNWISGAVAKPLEVKNKELNEYGSELVRDFLKGFFDAKEQALSEKDMDYLMDYLVKDSKFANAQIASIKELQNNKSERKFLKYELLDTLYINEEFVWIRVTESYRDHGQEGKGVKNHYISEYILKFTEDNEEVRMSAKLASIKVEN